MAVTNTTNTDSKCLHCGQGCPSGLSYCCSACEALHQELQKKPISRSTNPYAYLDEDNFKKHFLHQNKEYNYLFYVEGLHCSSCVHLLEKLPLYIEGVESAQVNYGSSLLKLQLSTEASLADVAYTLKDWGYTPTPLSPEEDASTSYQKENRIFLIRIAVAGAATGNIMLFVIPVYAGLAGELATIFNWLSFALYLPILFYSAIPFYKGAWNSIRYQVINVDLPITVAMLTSIGFSTYNLIRGDHNIYFDSTASFMFLILSARYLLKRVQQTYLSSNHLRTQITSDKYLCKKNNEWVSTTSQEIKPNDLVQIQTQQTLPCDGILKSQQALIDTSLFDGESLPKIYHEGMKLFAGTKNLSSVLELMTEKSFIDSRLGKLLKSLQQDALLKTQFIGLTDKLGQMLIVTVFLAAAIFFFVYSRTDFTEAFNRSLALIVLACPCALALGSPLTFGLALKKAQEHGILIKDGSVLEKILKIQHLFFDKTGTLTTGELSLQRTIPEQIPIEIKKIILTLEKNSYHPLAFALRKAWPEISGDLIIDSSQEILGFGVHGQYQGCHYEIKSNSADVDLDEEYQSLLVAKNGEKIAQLFFKDELRPESSSVLSSLQKKEINFFLLTGDKPLRAQKIAQLVGIKPENIIAMASPEEKLKKISETPQCCMIGDGANDALALKKADVGIAIKGSVDMSLQSCDAYFTKGGLDPLISLFNLAQITKKTLIRNITISLIYNSVGGTLALLGYINPMIAAILMPVSSVVIVLSSLWGFK